MAQDNKLLATQATATAARQSAPGELKIADLTRSHGLTDRYDDLLIQLFDTTKNRTSQLVTDSATRFCHHIRHTVNADTAYLCNRASLSLVATSSANSAHDSCKDTEALHTTLTTMVSDLWNCSSAIHLPALKTFANEAGFTYTVLPLRTDHDHLLIVVNAEIDSALAGDYLTDAMTAIFTVFLNSKAHQPTAAMCEAGVVDALHRKYKLSSQAITQRRLDIFSSTLKKHAVEFKGLSLVNKKDKPENLTTTLAAALYETAQLWGRKFTATLDRHCLIESAHGYKTLCENENLLKFSDSRALQIRVHATTLTDYTFIETMENLLHKGVVHPSKLQIDVIVQAEINHKDALKKLCERFGIPVPGRTRREYSSKSLSDEFNLLQTNGFIAPRALKQKT